MTELEQVRQELEYARQSAQQLPEWKQETIMLAWKAEDSTVGQGVQKTGTDPSPER